MRRENALKILVDASFVKRMRQQTLVIWGRIFVEIGRSAEFIRLNSRSVQNVQRDVI